MDEKLRDIISKALEDDYDKRASIEELLNHPFLQRSENDHDPVKLSSQLTELIKKYSSKKLSYVLHREK
jgi:serine/threonine protein kinase